MKQQSSKEKNQLDATYFIIYSILIQCSIDVWRLEIDCWNEDETYAAQQSPTQF